MSAAVDPWQRASGRRVNGPDPGLWLPAMDGGHVVPAAAGTLRQVLVSTMILAVIAGASMAYQARELQIAFDGRIPPGVVVDGISLGGMPEAEAVTLLRDRAAELTSAPIVVRMDTQTLGTTRQALGITTDVEAIVASMLAIGPGMSLLDWFDIRWRGAVVDFDRTLRVDRAPG